MSSSDLRKIYESYQNIYKKDPEEVISEAECECEDEESNEKETSEMNGKKKSKKEKEDEKEVEKEEVDTDLFDYLLEYLVSEGYADTNKAAIAIMVNMGEEWKQHIVEAKYGTSAGRKELAKKIRKGEEVGKSGAGTGFKAVEKAAKAGGARDPKAVAAAAMWKTYGK